MGAARKVTLFLFSSAVLLAGGLATVRGQSALDGFDPNANGTIRAVALQKDGKILIGGDFTALAPNGGPSVSRSHIARLNADGTLDATFDPHANATVRTIVVQPADGKILIGGDFTLVGEVPRFLRGRIARLDPATGLPDSFDPSADNIVRTIALQADGKVLAGGDFSTVSPNGGATIDRPHLVRVNPDGAADTFNPKPDKVVFSIVLQTDGKVLVGGDFASIGGSGRNRLARLSSTGVLDSFNPNANGTVAAIAVQADGNVLVGGGFTTIGAAQRNRVARLEPVLGRADSFNPNANAPVLAIQVQADGNILAGGDFTIIAGEGRRHFIRLDPATGQVDPSFGKPNPNNSVLSIVVQEDGKILLGGAFNGASSIGGLTRNFIARLEIDGQMDRTLNLSIVGNPNVGTGVFTIAVQTDGKILIGGFFSTVLGVPRSNIARLNTDGTLDNLFNPNANIIGAVHSIAVQADGRILVGGGFTSIGGQPRNHIARLDPTTGLADSFNPNANNQVFAIAVQADGKILVGGAFQQANSIGAQKRNFIAKLDPISGAADAFDPSPNGGVTAIAVQADKRILIGGCFTRLFPTATGGAQFIRLHMARVEPRFGLVDTFHPDADDCVSAIVVLPETKQILVGGQFSNIGAFTRHHMARLEPSAGLADPSFDPNASFLGGSGIAVDVSSIVLQADGKILVSGVFDRIGGQARHQIARLEPSLGSADSFDPNAMGALVMFAQPVVLALQADGKVLAGGIFTSIGGQPRNCFARLTNDTAARQQLIVTPTTVTLTREGASPQFARVTFEISDDNVTFTFLGDATPAGRNWTLTGLTLPSEKKFFIRARGFYRSGDNNGSESILGTRQNTFFPGSFVIGDRNAVVGQRVVFWGAQWTKSNSLSGGPAPASFKGFANSTSTSPAACGATWKSDPGNGSGMPAGLADTIDVIVASSINQSGGVLSGDIPMMAVVQPDPGYDSNPGHAGTGTVVSVSCDDQ